MSIARMFSRPSNRKLRQRRQSQLGTGARRALLMESLEDRRMLAVVWDRIEPLGSLIFQADVAGGIGGQVSVFSDDFESGSLGPEWTTNSSTPNGRVGVSNVLGAPANSGAFHLAMDTSVAGPNNLNEAILTIDLSGTTDASLEFAHKDVNDEDTALPATFVGSVFADGVSISDDGTTWYRLVSLNNANSPSNVYTDFTFDLDAAATTAGISLGSNFQIKFQQYDNFPFNSDGRTFDDVVITAPGPLSETTTAFLEADQTLTVVATPDDSSVTLTAIVRDPSNTVIASGTAAGPGETIDIQTIGILANGNYTVEISGDIATDYDLLLYRNATVEVVDTDDGAEQDATGSFIPLGSGRFGVVGTFDGGEVSTPEPGIGLLANNSSDVAVVFNPATNTVVGSVRVGPGGVGDALVTDDGSLGFVTDFQYRLWPIDISTVSLAGSPIPISNPGEDISITPDQQFLVVSDGSLNVPLSVVSTSLLTEVSTFSLGHDANSVEVADDGSILVTSWNSDNIRRLTIDGTGTISDTGEILGLLNPFNVVAAPGGLTGAVVLAGGQVVSFTTSGLSPVDTRSLSGISGITAAFNASGDRLYVRGNAPGGVGVVDIFAFDPATGAISAAPLNTISVQFVGGFFGMDQLTVAPSGDLYVPQPNSLDVYDGQGNFITSITNPAISAATGVDISKMGDASDIILLSPVSIENGAPVNPYGDPGEPGRFPNGPGAVAQPVAPNELLVNGSFETGDFTGWTTVVTSNPFRPWAVTGAGQGGGFGMLQTQPQDGSFVAWNGFDGGGPMEFQMYQDVAIAAGATATLSWMDRVQWNFTLGGPATLPRLYDVEIRDPVTNNVLSTLFSFSTDVQTVNPTGNTNWQFHSADVSSFAGQTVRLFFREQIPQSATGPAQIEFDAISLTEDTAGTTVETLYGGNSRGSALNPGGVLLIDQNTAAGTLLADPITPGGLPGLDFDSTGRLWGASIDGPGGNRVSNLVEINPDTGALISSVPITRGGIPISIGDLAVQPGTDAIFGIHSNSDATSFPGGELYTINRTTGAVTVVGNANSAAGGGIAFTTDGRLFQTAFSAPGGFQSLNELNPNNAARISTTALSPAVYYDGLAIRPSDGTFFGTAGGTGQQVFTINSTTGAGTFLGNTGVGSPSDLAFRVETVGGGPDVDEYLVDLTGRAGQLIDIAFSTDVDEDSDTTLVLLDTDGTTVLAAGAVVSTNFDLGILDFQIPADAIYTIRVSSTGQGNYGIVITDPLVFDTESNQPTDSPLRSLDAYHGALGFLGNGTTAGGDVDLSLLTSFESLNLADSGFIPPDPTLAVGPASLVAMVNTDIAIHDKTTGAVIAQADLDGGGGFWATNNIVFDPWITYDPASDRFFAIGIDRSSAGGGSSRLYLAVSTDSTPTNLTTDWNKYIIDRTGTHGGTGGSTFPDYPKLGVNDDAIFITGNDFGILSGGFSHASLFAIEKAPLLSGGAVNIVYDEVIGGAFSVHPVTVHDAGAPMYFAQAGSGGGSSITLHAITNVLTAPVRTTSTVGVASYAFPPDVPQQGGPPLDSVDARIMSGVVRDGSLWTAHAVQDLSVDTETVVRWYEFDITNFPAGSATLVQSGNVDPGPGIHTWMAHINVDNDGDMGIAFSVSGASQFAGIGYTGRLASDSPGTTRPVEIARVGEGSYSRFDSIGRNRWGDYSGLAIDPDGESFWLYNEYAASGNQWATFVGEFRLEPSGLAPDVDTYEVTLAAGQTIGLSTITPFDDPIDGLNLLDPSLEILNPNGVSVAFDSNSDTDGKNAALISFTAATAGVYKVIVAPENGGAGEYVLSVNRAPVLGDDLALSADMIFENESVSLSGSYSDQDLGDSHTVVIDWDDPNNAVDSTFAVPAINTLTVGDSFLSTDGTVLEITSLDLLTGEVGFAVSNHQYLDDGLAPGNGTSEDTSTVTVTVTDDGGLVAASAASSGTLFDNGLGQNNASSGHFSSQLRNWRVYDDFTLSDPASINSVFFQQGISPGGSLADFQFAIYADASGSPGTQLFATTISVGDYTATPNSISSFPFGQFYDFDFDLASPVALGAGTYYVSFYGLGATDFRTPNVGSGNSFYQQPGSGTIFTRAGDTPFRLKGGSQITVIVKNVDPTLVLDPVAMINENEAATLTGMITDQGLLDVHDLVINWDDPNATADATFAIPATSTLSVGDLFNSSTDGSVLEITAIDVSLGKVSFSVQHVYADDGAAPGNGTSSDVSTISASVSDDDLGISSGSGSGPIYTTEGDGTRLGTIDQTTGIGTDIGPFGTSQTWAAAFGVDGTLYTLINGFSGNAILASVDQLTGTATTIGTGVGTSMISLEVATDGTMYGIGYTDQILYEIDQTTGIATTIGSTGIGLNMDLAFDSSGTMYATVGNRLYTVDRITAASTLLGTYSGILSGQVMGIMFDENDTLFATAYINDSPLYEIDINTRSAAVVGNTGFVRPHGGDILLGAGAVTTEVLIKNVAPSLVLDPVAMINENEAATLTGMITDPGLLDEHNLVIGWDDPNAVANSTFALPATATLIVGSTFNSTTDGAVLEVTAIDFSTGKVSFSVQHVYADDGVAPGNGTASDTSVINGAVSDDDLGANGQTEFVVNGDFETADFGGWTVFNAGNGSWTINDGTFDPPGPGAALPPISGSFDAVTAQGGPGLHILSEPIVVPANVSIATLSWSDRIRNFAGAGFSDPNQEWRVQILDSGGSLIQEVYSTNPGDPVQQVGPNNRSFDLTTLLQSLTGQTIQISFEQQDSLGFFNVTLDDVSLQVVSGVETSVLVKNAAPQQVQLSGLAMINENDTYVLSGSFNDPGLLDEHDLRVDWDDPNNMIDSTFELSATADLSVGDTFASTTDSAVLTITGIAGGTVSYTVSHQYLDDGLAPGNGTPQDVTDIRVFIDDDDLGSGLGALSFDIKNVAPAINSVNISATQGNKALPGDDVILTATFTDIGLLDRHDVVIQWDDGTADSSFDVDATADLVVGDTFTSGDGSVLTITSVIPATGEVSFEVASHQFSTGGIFEINITISDDDTGLDDDGTQAWVSGVRIAGGVLQIIGTSGDDHVSINQQGNGTLKVHADFLPIGNFETFDSADIDKIIAYLCDGDDHFTIAGSVNIPAIVHGDGGNDHLNGGGGPSVLLGGDGDDMLVGGPGLGILIGGLGADRLVGGNSDDVLIGGTTNADDDDDTLMDALAAWTANDSYDNRVAAIDALLTVTDDEETDLITGSSGQDLFYDGDGDILTDVKTKKNPETVL